MRCPHRHHSLGKLYAMLGRHAEARAELSAAIARCRAMARTCWLPQAVMTPAPVEGR